MSLLHRFALVLALLPMTLGGAVLGVWLLTQWDWLMSTGVAVIYLGMLVCLVVPALLVVGWRQSVLAGEPPQRRFRRSLLILAVLLANVPAYGGAVVVASMRYARYTVTLRNDASTAWQGVVLEGGGVREALPPIAPASTVVQHLRFSTDGKLTLRQEAHAQPLVVEQYVTSGGGGAAKVVREANGTVVVATTVR